MPRLCQNPIVGACGLCKLLVLLDRIFEKLTFHTVSALVRLCAFFVFLVMLPPYECQVCSSYQLAYFLFSRNDHLFWKEFQQIINLVVLQNRQYPWVDS